METVKRDIYYYLIKARTNPVIGGLAYYMLKLLGAEIPTEVKIGDDFELAHGGFGVVIHPNTSIGKGVKIYPGVTLGRADIFRPITKSSFQGIIVEDGAILCPGAKILCDEGVLRVGKGSVIGANAVLLESTGQNEIWAGVPARRVGTRDADEQT